MVDTGYPNFYCYLYTNGKQNTIHSKNGAHFHTNPTSADFKDDTAFGLSPNPRAELPGQTVSHLIHPSCSSRCCCWFPCQSTLECWQSPAVAKSGFHLDPLPVKNHRFTIDLPVIYHRFTTDLPFGSMFLLRVSETCVSL